MTAARLPLPERVARPPEVLELLGRAWQEAPRPDLRPFLELGARSGLEERPLLLAMIPIDLEYRWKRKPPEAEDPPGALPARPNVEDYARLFPELLNEASTLVGLIAEEYRVRQKWGDRPGRADYFHRHSLFADRLDESFARVDAELARDPDWTVVEPGGDRGARPSAAPAGRPSPSLSHIAGYRVTGILGVGGMGTVHAAWDETFHRGIAVKVLLERHAGDRDIAKRFVEEAQITGQLQHPGIPPVHEFGTLADGRPFMAMKHIKGRTFSDLLRERTTLKASLPPLLQIFEQIAQTVAYAHSKDVIHRDLKPSNIMVGAFGEVQVMDWGMAKVLGDPRPGVPAAGGTGLSAPESVIETGRGPGSATQAGLIMGTPAYMPPEQARGEIDRVDPRSDVFALGAILCEILTGQPAYTGTPIEAHAKAQLGLTGDALERIGSSEADAEMLGLARRCLSVPPDGRPTDAKAVAGEMASYHAGVEKRLRQADAEGFRLALNAAADERAAAIAVATEQRRRRNWQMSLVTAAAILLAAGTGAIYVKYRAAREREDEAARETVIARKHADDADRRAAIESKHADDADRRAAIESKHADEVIRWLWLSRPDPEWHVRRQSELAGKNNDYGVALHRAGEQHARGVLAIEHSDYDRAFWHFVAAAALKPNPSE